MPSWIGVGVLLLACVVLVIWLLVQWTKQPRRFFRAGLADPERQRFTPEERGARAPETAEEARERGPLDTTADEEVAELIQGDRHDRTPITTDIDREAGRVLDEEMLNKEPDEGGDETRHGPSSPYPRSGGREETAAEERRRAAEEHHKAAEEHRRAAEALADEEDVPPGEEPADGLWQPRRGGIADRGSGQGGGV